MADKPKDPADAFRNLVTDWERNFDTMANKLMGTSEYSKAMNQFQNLQLEMQKRFNDLMAQNLSNLNMPSRDDMLRHIYGGILMGFGGVLALGCTVGHGITGMSALALGSSSPIVTVTSQPGGALALWGQLDGQELGEPRADAELEAVQDLVDVGVHQAGGRLLGLLGGSAP